MSVRTALPLAPTSKRGTLTPSRRSEPAPVATTPVSNGTCPVDPISGSKSAHSDFVQWLYQPHGEMVDEKLSKIETSTGMKREHIAYGIAGLLSLYLIAGAGAQFLCNLIGFAYPAYCSVKAVRTNDKSDDTQWLVYWTVFATFSLIDTFAVGICAWFPIYWLLKVSFLVYLYLPQTMGAQYLYIKVVDPLVTAIDGYMAKKNA